MLMFILGFFFMSALATIGAILLDNSHDYGIFFMGPVMWLVILLILLDRKITHYLEYHNVRSLVVCPDGQIRYIKNQLADTMRECKDRVYELPSFNDHPEWDVNDWDKKFVWCGIGNVRYAPKKVWKQYEPISKEEIEYAKNNPWEDDEA